MEPCYRFWILSFLVQRLILSGKQGLFSEKLLKSAVKFSIIKCKSCHVCNKSKVPFVHNLVILLIYFSTMTFLFVLIIWSYFLFTFERWLSLTNKFMSTEMLHPYAVQSSYFHVFKFAINAIINPEILEFFQIKNIFSVFNDLKRLFTVTYQSVSRRIPFK